ncbi:class I SAM-dependent methyltransferase [Paenibacillus sp. HJGM_3]
MRRVKQGNEKEIRLQFKEQAEHFRNPRLTLNNAELLSWVVNSFELNRTMKVLDVAAGTGIVSRAFAPHVAEVTAVDLSEDMIRQGRQLLVEQGIDNVRYVQGNVEQLPVENGQFDVVVSRLAFHHFVHPDKVLNEMARACRSDGVIGVIDMISPEEAELGYAYNHYERLRDPSHTVALTGSELIRLAEASGIAVTSADTVRVPVHAGNWLRMTKAGDEVAERILQAFATEAATGIHTTGMDPYRNQAGEWMFMQTWMKVIGCKRGEGGLP